MSNNLARKVQRFKARFNCAPGSAVQYKDKEGIKPFMPGLRAKLKNLNGKEFRSIRRMRRKLISRKMA